MDWLTAVAGLLTAVAAIAAGVFAVYRYFALRERMAAVRTAFGQAIDLLSSDDAVHQRTGAIMLRRFFDSKTEQGGKGTPYAGEALNVIAAVLRGAETGGQQKLLADGLAYAPDLRGADLQKTNLQQAYLGARADHDVDLSGADFYRADLTGASLKGAIARQAVFYQARLVNTVFRDADLTGANFYEADVSGAVFAGERLRLGGANFAHARNVPAHIAERLSEGGVYDDPAPGEPPAPSAPAVFLSRPGSADIDVRRSLWALADRVQQQGLDVVEIDRGSYASTGAVAEVRRVMRGCSGVIVCAVADLRVATATWRSATPETRDISDIGLTTPWTMLELGVAVGLGLPVLLALGDDVDPQAFDFGLAEPGVSLLHLGEDHLSQAFRERFDDWVGAVREVARRTGHPESLARPRTTVVTDE